MSEAMAVLEISELLVLLLVASAVALATKYIKFPYTSALVLVGLALGTTGLVPDIELSEELVFFVFLPPLLFEGALRMDITHLRENLRPILLFAVPGVIIAASTVGLILNAVLGIDLPLALLFGAMITPTDPVSILATFKRLGVPHKLSMIIEGESVFNDGTGVVIFGIILGMINTGEIGLLSGVLRFFFVVIGGAVVGLLLGYAAFKALENIDDHLVEVTVTIILAIAVFIVAETLHTSGVIGVVMAGLVMGNYGQMFAMSPTSRVALTTFWDLAVFIVNSLVFILIGKEIHLNILSERAFEIGVAIIAVLLARGVSVYPLSALFNLKSSSKMPVSWQHTSFWGGLHGSIPVALALGLSKNFAGRDLIIAMTFGVVLFSLVVQGLTFELLIPRFRLKEVDEEMILYEKKLGESIVLKAAIEELDRMDKAREISTTAIEDLRARYRMRKKELKEEIRSTVSGQGKIRKREDLIARRGALLAMKSALRDALRKGIISDEAAVDLSQEIDAELDNLVIDYY